MISNNAIVFENADTPEVVAFKEKVFEVATRYAKKHGWCNEVDFALKEMGIDDKTVAIDVMTTLGSTEVRLAVSKLAGKTYEQQVKAIGDAIGTIRIGSKHFDVPEDFITSIALKKQQVFNDPRWRYSSNEGKVLHFFESDTTYALCVCCCSYYYQSTATSSRGDNRHCENCERILSARGN